VLNNPCPLSKLVTVAVQVSPLQIWLSKVSQISAVVVDEPLIEKL
jgi:hypothetical protein